MNYHAGSYASHTSHAVMPSISSFRLRMRRKAFTIQIPITRSLSLTGSVTVKFWETMWDMKFEQSYPGNIFLPRLSGWTHRSGSGLGIRLSGRYADARQECLECLSGGTNTFLTGPVKLLVIGNYSKESCLGRVYETAYDPIQYPTFSSPKSISVGGGKKNNLCFFAQHRNRLILIQNLHLDRATLHVCTRMERLHRVLNPKPMRHQFSYPS